MHSIYIFTMVGAYVKEPEEKYLGGSMEIFEGVLAMRVNIAAVMSFCEFLGCHKNAKYMYRIPTGDSNLRFTQLEVEDDVIDIVV